MDKINILYLIATLDIGGAERQLVELVKRLDRRKFNPIVCCLTRGGFLLEDELKDSKIEYLILSKKFKFDFSVIFKLITILKQKNIHILHTWMFTSNFFGRVSGIFSRVPIIIASERGVDRWKNKFYLLIDWALSYFTDRIICVSKGVRNFYNRYANISLSKLITIYGGIELNKQINISEQKKEEFGFKKDSTVITTIGHLVSYKGIKYMLFAAVKVINNFPGVRFLIVGEGPDENRLKKLVKKLNISQNVIFIGLRRDIRDILSITNIFVLPSLIEGLPNVIMEAMLAGKSVIATHIPGNDELVVDGETGMLVPPKDTDSLASAIIDFLKNPAKAKEMGLKGRKRIEKYFSIDETVRKTEELYETLVKLKIRN